MKTVCKKLLCLLLVAMMLVSAVPAAFAAEGDDTVLWMELWIDGVHKESGVQMPCKVGDEITAAQVRDFAANAWSDEFATYEFVSADGATITDGVNGVRVHLKTAEGCKHENTVVGTTATCTAGGTEVVRCSDCGYKVSLKEVAALGHNYKNGVCTRCNEAEPKVENKTRIDIYESDIDGNAKHIGSKEVDVKAYASVDAMVKAIYGKQYSDYRYRDFGDGTAQLVIYAVDTKDDKSVYQLKVIHNNSTSDYTLIDIYEGEGILAAVSNAGVVKKLKTMGKVVDGEEYILVGFSINHTGNSKTSLNIYHTADADLADANGYIKVYADWEKKTDDTDDEFEFTDGTGGLYGDENDDPIYDVVLQIYTNGKTSSYAKKVGASEMGTYTKDGKLTRAEVELVVQRYFKTNDNTKYYGLFTTKTWDKGDYDVDYAVSSITLDPDNTMTVYVMVKDATARVADSSNPKTGDTITFAATTMVMAAAALVTLTELKKRKMI